MPPMPNREDLGATWNYLETGIKKIMLDLENGLDMQTYMGVYTAVHNFCTSQKAIGTQATGVIGGAHRGAHLLGEDLYNNLRGYLDDHLDDLTDGAQGHSDEALLVYYMAEWDRYTTSAKYINHLFRYLNRHWVKREIEEGKKNIYDVYTLHLMTWRGTFFQRVNENIMDAVLKMVEKHRQGESIEQARIKAIVDSFVSLGLDESDPSKGTLDCYRFHFEKPFLAATKKYYEVESKQYIAEHSIIDYLKKAELRLEQEEERVRQYLHPDITLELRKTCNQALIADHSNVLRDEFQMLLDEDRVDDMARMYGLLVRIQNGLDPLRQKFESHVRTAGLAAIAKVATDADKIDPKAYVDAILDIHTKFKSLVDKAFAGETEFTRSLDNACKEFMNRNHVCKAGHNKSPEILAKYADTLLKKGPATTTEAEIEARLVQLMIVFKYLDDKDVFQKFYSRLLARRLVHMNSSSDDAELSMINKLREDSGYDFVNKLQRMFQDIQTSKDMNNAFKEFESNLADPEDTNRNLDANFYILGTSFWPLNAPTTTFAAPPELVRSYEHFEKFYGQKHSGRKLTWLWQLCKGEVKATYLKAHQKQPIIFTVSAYQLAILLLFNEKDENTYEEIQSATKLDKSTMDMNMSLFAKFKVLTQSPDGQHTPTTKYSLNYDFKSKRVRLNLNIGVKAEQKAEADETHKTIEEDRKLLMQSAIVRIMKSRKKMKHQLLVGETINQIRSRFTPKIPDIKKCIEILLEKEYLERLDDDEIGYLA